MLRERGVDRGGVDCRQTELGGVDADERDPSEERVERVVVGEGAEAFRAHRVGEHLGGGFGISELGAHLLEDQAIVGEAADGIDPLGRRVPDEIGLVADPLGEELDERVEVGRAGDADDGSARAALGSLLDVDGDDEIGVGDAAVGRERGGASGGEDDLACGPTGGAIGAAKSANAIGIAGEDR